MAEADGKTRNIQESWWVLRAQAGDRSALDLLLASVQRPLFGYIYTLVREPHAAEDILQEVFLRIYRKLGWLEQPELFRPWVYRIASREAFRHLKRERRWSEQVREEDVLAELPAAESRPEQFSRETVAELHEKIVDISPASRAVIELFYLHELSLEEVAAVLEIPVGTVKSRLNYGLIALRKQMKPG